jgi:hypothetical protein
MIKKFISFMLIIGGMLFWFFVAVGILSSERVIKYDCTTVEFNPDIPLEVREACRKIRHVTSV